MTQFKKGDVVEILEKHHDPGHGDRNIEAQRVIKSEGNANGENMMSSTSRSAHMSQNKVPKKPFEV